MVATATSKSTSLCPFTLKFIAEIKQEDLAVIYNTNPLLTNDPSPVETDGSAEEARAAFDCGHACTLTNLVSYLHDGGGGAKMCPACQLSPASVVCDSPSSDYLTRPSSSSAQNDTNGSNGDGGGGRIISFRYGTVFYFLWVQSPPPSLSSSSYEKIFRIRNGNALHRIGSVLGMDVESGLKVIHKGKVIHPVTGRRDASKGENFEDVSEQLLDISSADLIHRRKKPSLVVMGLRKRTTSVRCDTKFFGVFLSIARRSSPLYPWKALTGGFRWTFMAISTLAGGVFLFLRSVLYPPQPRSSEG